MYCSNSTYDDRGHESDEADDSVTREWQQTNKLRGKRAVFELSGAYGPSNEPEVLGLVPCNDVVGRHVVELTKT